MITTIITFIIVFGILVIVHEFGHFIVAKRSGIMVREFSIGMGPKLFYHRANGTTYTLRLLPLGGYVRMAGSADDEASDLRPGMQVSLRVNQNNQVESINTSKKHTLFKGLPLEITDYDLQKGLWIEGHVNGDESTKQRFEVDHDATIVEQDGVEVQIAPVDVQYESASVGRKLLTNFAGVFNNVLLAIIAFALLSFAQGGVLTNSNQVNTASQDSVAKDAGLHDRDRILAINNQKTNNWTDIQQQVQSKPNQKINLDVQRGNQQVPLSMKVSSKESNGNHYGMIGISQTLDNSFKAKALSGFTQTWTLAKRIFVALWTMVTGHFSLNDLGGPVAIFANTSQATQLGIAGVLQFLGFLSINLAIMNLLPIPALDGGKIVLNIIEGIRGKPTSEKVATIVTLIGFVFILVLMILVTWNDINRYFLH